MSKIYEALENAHQGLKVSKVRAAPIPLEIRPKTVPKIVVEDRMVSLYQSVESLLPHTEKKVIQFMGSCRGEGTSTVAHEFARMIAIKMKKSVLLLDADGINHAQLLFFGIDPECSLEEVVNEGVPIGRAFCRVGHSGLTVAFVSRGTPLSRIFDSPKMDELWGTFMERFDFVIIDSPPATNRDGLALFRKADGVILVLEAEKTRWPVVESVKERILKDGGNLLGIVLNKRHYHIPKAIYRRL